MPKLIECSFDEFSERVASKKIICYGCGATGKTFFETYKNEKWFQNIDYFVDNGVEYEIIQFHYNGRIFPIRSLEEASCDNNTVLLLTVGFNLADEIIEEISKSSLSCIEEIYVLGVLVRNSVTNNTLPEIVLNCKTEEEQIPRKIHYCWFGSKEIPGHLQKFMDSWKKFCPSYEIVKWDENNYDLLKNEFLQYALQKKNYAYCSDYARLDIVYNEGGLYLDCDVELLRNVDELLHFQAFFGKNYNGDMRFPLNTGSGFGAAKGNKIVKEMRDYYHTADLSEYNNGCAYFQYQIVKNYNKNSMYTNDFDVIDDNTVVFPYEYFHPKDLYSYGKITEKAYAIHQSESSWMEIKPNRFYFLNNLCKLK